MPGMMYNVIKSPNELKAHKENVAIYGDENVDTDLVESIKEKGLLEPIVIKDDNTIISGHRRWLAAKYIGLEKIPCRTISFNDDLDELESLVEFNRQRDKTFSQRMKEAETLTVIESERAKKRKEATMLNGKNKAGEHVFKESVRPTLAPPNEETIDTVVDKVTHKIETKEEEKKGKTAEKVAEKIGMKKSTFQKAETVWKKAGNGDNTAKELIKKVDSGEVTINKAYNEIKKIERIEKRKEIEIKEPKKDIKRNNNVLVCDPPWKYDFATSSNREIENHYPTMTLQEMKELKINSAENAVMLMWATAPKLNDAIELLETWGFKYKTCAVWDKEIIGMGYWFRGQHEIILVGVKGKFSPPIPENRYSSVIKEKRTAHSKKPECLYDMVEKMFPNCEYLEMFARNTREGWGAWGNQV